MNTNKDISTFNVQKYFDLKAHGYLESEKRVFWNVIKNKEKIAVLNMLEPASGNFILDAGCGAGYYMSALAELGCLVEGIDLSPRMAEEAKKLGFNTRVLDLESGQDIGVKYDKIVCAGVLEFCNDPAKVLMNLRGALRSNAFIILLVPKFSFEGIFYKMFHRYFGCKEFIKLYGIRDIDELARRCNLRISHVTSPTSYSLAVKLWTKN